MIKESIILTFSKGIRGILMLIFNMIIARVFTENLLGTYKHINLVMNIFSTVCTIGIPTSISCLYGTYDKNKKSKLISNTILLLGGISILSFITIIIFKEQLALILNNSDILLYINILALYVAVMIISSFLENLYISSNQSVLLGKIYILYAITNFIAMILSVVAFNSLHLLIILIVAIEVIRTVVMFAIIKHLENLYINIDINMLKPLLKFSLPLGIVSIVQTINTYIDNLFISNNYPPDKYAAYANAATDIPFVGIITVSVAAVILPIMAKEYKKNNNFKGVLEIWGDSSKKTAVIMFPIFWIAILFSSGYIEFIFSEKYVISSTPIFIIYLLKFPLYCTVYGNVLVVFGKQRYVMYNSIIGIILNSALNLVFIKIFGIIGPAISTVIVQYVVVILQLIQISKHSNVKFMNIMPFKDLFKIFILPSIIAIPIYFLGELLNIPQWIGLIVFGIIIYLGSMLIYYKFKYIDKSVISLVKNRGISR